MYYYGTDDESGTTTIADATTTTTSNLPDPATRVSVATLCHSIAAIGNIQQLLIVPATAGTVRPAPLPLPPPEPVWVGYHQNRCGMCGSDNDCSGCTS